MISVSTSRVFLRVVCECFQLAVCACGLADKNVDTAAGGRGSVEHHWARFIRLCTPLAALMRCAAATAIGIPSDKIRYDSDIIAMCKNSGQV